MSTYTTSEVVRIVAGGVRGQVVKDTTYDVQETNQGLDKLEFVFVLQDGGGGLGCLRDLVSNAVFWHRTCSKTDVYVYGRVCMSHYIVGRVV